ncbi:MAG TPA: hypothetical protein VHU61_05950 [Solirubrobacteraceae bacterium]|nr:hypothetical protein [Solirubrobacteraceae bacterium]
MNTPCSSGRSRLQVVDRNGAIDRPSHQQLQVSAGVGPLPCLGDDQRLGQ